MREKAPQHDPPDLRMDRVGGAPVDGVGTWNSPDAIARHREMTPDERIRRMIELSCAALRFATAERSDER